MKTEERESLLTARAMLFDSESSIIDVCVHYFKVHELNSDNAEAEFFAAYLGYNSLVEEGDGASAANAFKAMTNCLKKAVVCVKESEGSVDEKYMVLCTMVKAYTPITRFLFTKRLSTSSNTIESGVIGLYTLGTAIKNEFGSKYMELVVEPWKEAVSLQKTYYAYKYNGVKPDDYVAEIQKFDPTYTVPNKAGCISFAK